MTGISKGEGWREGTGAAEGIEEKPEGKPCAPMSKQSKHENGERASGPNHVEKAKAPAKKKGTEEKKRKHAANKKKEVKSEESAEKKSSHEKKRKHGTSLVDVDENDNVEKVEFSVSQSSGVDFRRTAESGPVVAQPKKFQEAATHAEEAEENIHHTHHEHSTGGSFESHHLMLEEAVGRREKKSVDRDTGTEGAAASAEMKEKANMEKKGTNEKAATIGKKKKKGKSKAGAGSEEKKNRKPRRKNNAKRTGRRTVAK
jgi:hypothetical protein